MKQIFSYILLIAAILLLIIPAIECLIRRICSWLKNAILQKEPS